MAAYDGTGLHRIADDLGLAPRDHGRDRAAPTRGGRSWVEDAADVAAGEASELLAKHAAFRDEYGDETPA